MCRHTWVSKYVYIYMRIHIYIHIYIYIYIYAGCKRMLGSEVLEAVHVVCPRKLDAHQSLWAGSAPTHCHSPQHTATHCNTLQHAATHCNTPQHTARILIHSMQKFSKVTVILHREVVASWLFVGTRNSRNSRNSQNSDATKCTRCNDNCAEYENVLSL